MNNEIGDQEIDSTVEALGHNFHVRVSKGLTLMQRAVEYAVAAGLLVLACITIVGAGNDVISGVREHIATSSLVSHGMDTLLLTLILLELLHTVLSHAPLMKRLAEFMIIGVFSAVRYGLEVVASTDRAVSGAFVTDPRTVAGSLALDAVGICLLVVTLTLVRKMNDEKSL